jgi:hypothetical protein
MERFPRDATTLEEASRYLHNRALQLLGVGAKMVGFGNLNDEAVTALFEYKGEIYGSVYLLSQYRGQGRFRELALSLGVPVITVPDCDLELYLKKTGLPHKVVDPHPNCWAEYAAVEEFYGDTRAKRTGVFYMNHIDEGLAVIQKLGFGELAEKVFCLHPLFQNDEDFTKTSKDQDLLNDLDPLALLGAMEYRQVANAHLAHHEPQKPKLSCTDAVNQALIADKVQNRKDFEKYHKGVHPNSDRLEAYFQEWFYALGVAEAVYHGLCEDLEVFA